MLISRRPLRTRQPDLCFISHARIGIAKDQIEGAPDLVVEILSPGNTRRKVSEKLDDYARVGVPEVWVANPKSKTLDIQVLSEDKYRSVSVCSAGQRVPSKVLPGFLLPAGAFE